VITGRTGCRLHAVAWDMSMGASRGPAGARAPLTAIPSSRASEQPPDLAEFVIIHRTALYWRGRLVTESSPRWPMRAGAQPMERQAWNSSRSSSSGAASP
jgi:hypothetical protein